MEPEELFKELERRLAELRDELAVVDIYSLRLSEIDPTMSHLVDEAISVKCRAWQLKRLKSRPGQISKIEEIERRAQEFHRAVIAKRNLCSDLPPIYTGPSIIGTESGFFLPWPDHAQPGR